MKKLFFPFIILFITACNFQGTTLEEQRWQERANNVEIIRDDFGVPHIYGKTDTKPFRKMGHVTITGDTLIEVKNIAEKVKESINVKA